MPTPAYTHLDYDIFCIDALYTAPDIACLYLIKGGDDYAFIETGTNRSIGNINAVLNDLEISPDQIRYVIPTHVHLDHAGAAGTLMRMFPRAELLIHPRGARHMIDPTRLIESSVAVYGQALFDELYGEIVPIAEHRVRIIADHEQILLGNRELTFRHMRGHADHHFCIFDPKSRGWFTGDMFGISYPSMRFDDRSLVVPATTPTQFDPERYVSSVEELASNSPRAMYLTHYGALDFSAGHVVQLSRQLRAYARFGEESNGDTTLIEQKIRRLLDDELSELTPEDAKNPLQVSFGGDVALNAQGIAWWAQRPNSS